MKKILALILALFMISTASALVEMRSDASVTFGPRNVGRCYFDINEGTVCPSISQSQTQIFPGDHIEECYFDRVRGAVCPDFLPSQGVFLSRRVDPADQFQRNLYDPPPRVSTRGPTVITGDFKPRFEQRVYYRARLPYQFSHNVD